MKVPEKDRPQYIHWALKFIIQADRSKLLCILFVRCFFFILRICTAMSGMNTTIKIYKSSLLFYILYTGVYWVSSFVMCFEFRAKISLQIAMESFSDSIKSQSLIISYSLSACIMAGQLSCSDHFTVFSNEIVQFLQNASKRRPFIRIRWPTCH